MLIKYYKSNEQYNISYSSRNRFRQIPISSFASEIQKSIKFGDGAATQIKTSVNNLCDYVEIDDTRWFVVSYLYLNGKQVILNLQRDVVGEMGISSCYGKIERGYTETVLRNRKELQLNQILKERKKLIPKSNLYGNFTVSNHINEMWGILYLVKPSGINPETGEKYEDKLNINIPAFTPNYVDFPYIENGTIKTYGDLVRSNLVSLWVAFNQSSSIFKITISLNYSNGSYVPSVSVLKLTGPIDTSLYTVKLSLSSDIYISDNVLRQVCEWVGYQIGNAVVNNPDAKKGYSFPAEVPNDNANRQYENAIIKKGNDFYSYKLSETVKYSYGDLSASKLRFVMYYVTQVIFNKEVSVTDGLISGTVRISSIGENTDYPNLDRVSGCYRQAYMFNATKLTESEAGMLTIDLNIQLVDEPYSVLVFPLFDVTLSDGTSENTFVIEKKLAFSIFNTIIEYLSGNNAYLVDAQIYPYCPELTSVVSKLQGYPFFQIMSTTVERECEVQLLPYSDIKKEYIEREYTIISPEQTGRFTFNFYDYITTVEDNDGINYAVMSILIKTAFKPFAIVSSAVIQPQANSLIGITYGSDLRGSQPSSNGFECSLSSNAFEEYKRSNSNYQQIFALQQEELKKQHEVELANDITSTVINTASATTMGAIAGASLGDTGIGNLFGTKTAGAAVGAATTGATVGAAMIAQTVMNNQLRDYEEYLQQQNFDLNIGTIKNIPNSVNRISSFNEIILRDFWYIIEVYECSDYEKEIVDNFINQYGYSIGVFDFVSNYYRNGWFLRSTLVKSNYPVNLHIIAEKELMGGIYLYEQV